jgi:two-component system chemotaxis sensor kinase CheA
MDQYTKDFLEEASELTEKLENSLIQLEERPEDKELITGIFRAMHSLKGSSGMFGFNRISEFTHNMETIWELLRDGKILLSKSLIDITLASVDHIKALLKDPSIKDPKNQENHSGLLNRISEIADLMGLDEILAAIEQVRLRDQESFHNLEHFKTYYISFQSISDINILFLFGEILNLGQSKIYPYFNQIPSLENFDETKNYIHWKIFLATKAEKNEIEDSFIFVENPEIEIIQLSEQNLFDDFRFINTIESVAKEQKNFDINELRIFGGLEEIKTPELVHKEKKEAEVIQTIENNVEDVTQEYIKSTFNLHHLSTEEKSEQPIVKEHYDSDVISSIRVSADKIDDVMKLVSELITTQARLNLVTEENPIPALTAVTRTLQKLTRQLRDKSFSLSLLPIESVLTRFHRLVRDLSNKFNKEIIFETEGTETEIDKTLLQNLSEPVMHMIRNSIDHGIEEKEKRIALGKPVQGKITLKAFYYGANVHVQIIDDGAGIDPYKIHEKAIQKGLVSPTAVYSEQDKLNMIFLPGVSTAQKLTDVSGRGVGMDVVKQKIEEVRGEVEIDSTVNVGTTITVKLPLTLSIIDGLLVLIGGVKYIIQLSAVQKIYRTKYENLNQYNNLIVLEGNQIPFHYLRNEFEIETEPPSEMKIVTVYYEGRKIGLVVDDVIGEYQAVIKPLGKLYRSVDIISGGTILGDGIVALVMDTNKMIKRFSMEF